MAGQDRETAVSRRQEFRRSELLDAAATVFAEKGFFGASTKDIARRVVMTQSALYYYFPSKEAALEAVCFAAASGYNKRLAEIVTRDDSARRRLQAAIAAHLAPLATRHEHVLTYHNERHHLPTEARHEIGRLAREYEAMLLELITGGQRTGEFRPALDARVATLVILAACNSVAHYYKKATDLELDEIAARTADTLLDGVSA